MLVNGDNLRPTIRNDVADYCKTWLTRHKAARDIIIINIIIKLIKMSF
jgi:hypothetical protein